MSQTNGIGLSSKVPSSLDIDMYDLDLVLPDDYQQPPSPPPKVSAHSTFNTSAQLPQQGSLTANQRLASTFFQNYTVSKQEDQNEPKQDHPPLVEKPCQTISIFGSCEETMMQQPRHRYSSFSSGRRSGKINQASAANEESKEMHAPAQLNDRQKIKQALKLVAPDEPLCARVSIGNEEFALKVSVQQLLALVSKEQEGLSEMMTQPRSSVEHSRFSDQVQTVHRNSVSYKSNSNLERAPERQTTMNETKSPAKMIPKMKMTNKLKNILNLSPKEKSEAKENTSPVEPKSEQPCEAKSKRRSTEHGQKIFNSMSKVQSTHACLKHSHTMQAPCIEDEEDQDAEYTSSSQITGLTSPIKKNSSHSKSHYLTQAPSAICLDLIGQLKYIDHISDPVSSLQTQEKIRLIERLKEELAQTVNTQNNMINYLKAEGVIRDEQHFLKNFQSKTEAMNQKLHMVYMFSSPLVSDQEQENFQRYLIDFHSENVCIKKGIAQSESQIRFQAVHATKHNWIKLLQKGFLVLHFSGHGEQNLPCHFSYESYKKLLGQGDVIEFEDRTGEVDYMSEQMLKKDLQQYRQTELQVVFISSCHSERTGVIFRNAGVKHVVCVRENEEISDKACIEFARQFYFLLFCQKNQVCDAFFKAQDYIKNHNDVEIRKDFCNFILLREGDCYESMSRQEYYQQMQLNRQKGQHQCNYIGPFCRGTIQDLGLTEKPMFELEMSKINSMFGRRKEMSELIGLVNDSNSRLVSIIGYPGSGKTMVAKSIGLFYEDRKVFRDGLIYISLAERYQASMFINCLLQIIVKQMPTEHLKLLKQKSKDIRERRDSQLGGEAPLADLASEQLEKVIHCLQDKEALIILDSVNHILTDAAETRVFKAILKRIIDKCSQVKFLTTSIKRLHDLDHIKEIQFVLPELSPFWSVKLFLELASISDEQQEIRELLQAEGEEGQLDPNNLTEKELHSKLAEHNMIRQMRGLPLQITLIAPLSRDNSLLSIYKKLKSKDFTSNLEHDLHPLYPLIVTLEASIKNMREKDPKTVELFCLIGLFPGGVTEDGLRKDLLWGSDYDLYLKSLRDANLIQKKEYARETRFTLLPFMSNYALSKHNYKLKEQHLQVCKYINSILQKLLDAFDPSDKGTQDYVKHTLLSYETNLWSAFDRMLLFNDEEIFRNEHVVSDTSESFLLHREDTCWGKDNLSYIRQVSNKSAMLERLNTIGKGSKLQKQTTLNCAKEPKVRKNRFTSEIDSKEKRAKSVKDDSVMKLSSNELNLRHSIGSQTSFSRLSSDSDCDLLDENLSEIFQNLDTQFIQQKSMKKDGSNKDRIDTKLEDPESLENGSSHLNSQKANQMPLIKIFEQVEEPRLGHLQQAAQNLSIPGAVGLARQRSNTDNENNFQVRALDYKAHHPEVSEAGGINQMQFLAPPNHNPNLVKQKSARCQHSNFQRVSSIRKMYTRKNTSQSFHRKVSRGIKKQATQMNRQGCTLPIEALVILNFASLLILINNLDAAIQVLEQIGMVFSVTGDAGLLVHANVSKLLALAYIRHDSDICKAGKLLDHAKKDFDAIDDRLGKAISDLGIAYLLQNYPEHFDQGKCIERCNAAQAMYKAINHPIGQACAIKLKIQMHEQLRHFQNKKDAQLGKQLEKFNKNLARKSKSKFILKTSDQFTSLMLQLVDKLPDSTKQDAQAIQLAQSTAITHKATASIAPTNSQFETNVHQNSEECVHDMENPEEEEAPNPLMRAETIFMRVDHDSDNSDVNDSDFQTPNESSEHKEESEETKQSVVLSDILSSTSSHQSSQQTSQEIQSNQPPLALFSTKRVLNTIDEVSEHGFESEENDRKVQGKKKKQGIILKRKILQKSNSVKRKKENEMKAQKTAYKKQLYKERSLHKKSISHYEEEKHA